MGWTSLFLKVEGKKVLIVGTGEVGSRRAHRFLKEGAELILAGNNISEELKDKGAILKSTKNIEKWVDWADIVVVASGDTKLNNYVSTLSGEKLINRADLPEEGNLIVPTNFYIDDVQISIFTNGKSPLMARELRKKIQQNITHEDILKIKIQDYARINLKKVVKNQKDRKKYLYDIIKDKTIENLLVNGKIEEAKEYVDSLVLKLNSKNN